VSVFFGGGTPSLMEPRTVEALIAQVQRQFACEPDMEITLEANPTSVEADKLREFRDAGVNRVSLGVQALNADSLRFLGRKHSGGEALKAVEMAASLFARYSFDLIYARPGQSVAAWERELRAALPYARGHLSLYQLTIEENTPFHLHHAQGRFSMPEDTLAADMYEATQGIMEEAGLPMYEVSNHAAPGQESRHNLAYWRGEEYLGIGPGAHGRVQGSGIGDWGLGRMATVTHKLPEKWLRQVKEKGQGLQKIEPVDAQAAFAERILMGLRLKEGVALQLDEKTLAGLTPYLREGLLVYEAGRLAATRKGMLVLNSLTGEVLATSAD
jgi:oxygen-independent coproporphyrinogen-3 oxidase